LIDPSRNGYKHERSLDFYRQLQEHLDAIPGVESSAFAVVPILTGDEWDNSIAIEGFSHKPTETPDPHMQFISPDFFKTMQIPILNGRDFRITDARTAPKVAIVNEHFAQRYFPHGDAVGRHIGQGKKLDTEIIAVVRDTKYESMRDEIPEEVYEPIHQVNFVIGVMAYVRTSRQPEQA